jgi:hypothetical protein
LGVDANRSFALWVVPLITSSLIAESDGKANVVILTDSQYAVADRKAKTMQRIVQSCKTCSVLDYVDSPMAESSTRMPQLVVSLKQRFGSKLDWILAVRSGISRPDGGPENICDPDNGYRDKYITFDRCKQRVFVEFCIEIGARFLF